MEWSRGAQGFLKFCYFVAGPPRTQELRGCWDRGREGQRDPMASPRAWIPPAHPIGHTRRGCFRWAKEIRSSLCSGGCDHPALSLLSLYRGKGTLCSFISLASYPWTLLTVTSLTVSVFSHKMVGLVIFALFLSLSFWLNCHLYLQV